MNPARKQEIILRLLSGICYIRCNEDSYLLYPNTLQEQVLAHAYYMDYMENNGFAGLYDENEILQKMSEEGLWSVEEEERIEKIPKEMEELKFELFNSSFKIKRREKIRRHLNNIREEMSRLERKRRLNFYVTDVGAAALAKNRFLTGLALRDVSGKRIFQDPSFMETYRGKVLDDAIEARALNQIQDSEYREIARTEPWRSYWSAAKTENSLFGVPSKSLNDEQRNVVIFSRMYDSIYEHPECPDDSVIEDDDLIDGWLIHQSRKQKEERKKAIGDQYAHKGKKQDGQQEVFIPVGGEEDFKRVEAMNDLRARMIKKNRDNVLVQKGRVTADQMPDAQLDIRRQAHEQALQAMRGKK